jgi:uncharacterized membrane protein
MANALSGTAGSVAYITGGTAAVGSIKEWSLSLTHNPVETSAFSDEWQTFIASLRGATGSFAGNGDVNDATHTSLRNAMMGGSAVALRFYNGPDWFWEAGTAYLTGNERSISNEGKLELSYDFTVSGAITYGGLWLHNGTWSIGINQLTNTPTQGSNALTDGGLETWASATNLTSWTESVAGTSTVNQETSSVHGGSNAARLDVDSSGSSVFISQNAATNGTWYQLVGWAKNSTTGKSFSLGTAANPWAVVKNLVLTTAYAQYTVADRATAAGLVISRSSGLSASSSIYLDDLTLYPLTLNQLFAVRLGTANPASVAANLTITQGCVCGVVYGLDSYTAPTTFIYAIHDGLTSVQMIKCVSGTYTSLVSATVSYVAGAQIKIVYTGSNTYQLWYNGTQRGTDQTVSDAGTGVYHGALSTYSGNTISGFVVA